MLRSAPHVLVARGMPARAPLSPPIQRRQPEQTVLYRTIQAHLPTFLLQTAGEDGTGGLPAFVRQGRVALGPRAGQALRRAPLGGGRVRFLRALRPARGLQPGPGC